MQISKTASAILDKLTADMEPGQSRHIGEKGGAIMQVVVERLTEGLYSVAHYYEQNGDLVADPDVEFYKAPTGAWLPVSIQQSWGHQQAIEFEDGQPARYYPRRVRDLCSFTTTWMKNIKFQQDLRSIPAAS